MKFVLPVVLAFVFSLIATAKTFYIQAEIGKFHWNNLCGLNGAKQDSADVPYPNYNHPLIRQASQKLNYIDRKQASKENTFWLYSGLEKVYGLCSYKKHCPKIIHNNQVISQSAHNFLTILCGEYRDYPSMLTKKLDWINRIHLVKKGKQGYDPARGVFQQLTGEGYQDLIKLTRRLYLMKRRELGNFSEPSLEREQLSVPAITACEYRYILKEYLAKQKKLGFFPVDMKRYQSGLDQFLTSGECSQAEKDYYNEFRGDGNFKPQTLESNAFIWNSRVYAKNCESTQRAKKVSAFTDHDCISYFTKPFATRYEKSKQGLLRLLFNPIEYDLALRSYEKKLLFIVEDLNLDGISEMLVLNKKKPAGKFIYELRDLIQEFGGRRKYSSTLKYSRLLQYAILKKVIGDPRIDPSLRPQLKLAYNNSQRHILNFKKRWQKKIERGKNQQLKYYLSMLKYFLGLDELEGIEIVFDTLYIKDLFEDRKDKGFHCVFPDKDDAWDRLASVLDRHTAWKMIDMLSLTGGVHLPTYSPFVASSYYINKSDPFTRAGYSMGIPSDGKRHWMFIQKVRKDKWFKASDFNDWHDETLDLFSTWFDETTISRSKLGEDEQGFDRFGIIAPEEIEANLWLYEI